MQNSPASAPAATLLLDIIGKLSAHVGAAHPTFTNRVLAFARITGIVGLDEVVQTQCSRVSGLCDPDAVEPFVVKVEVAPDTPETLEMGVIVNGGEGGGSATDASASIDPMVVIDPSSPFKDDYHLVFRPNLPLAGSPVPAPASWALLLFGAGTIGLRLERECWRKRDMTKHGFQAVTSNRNHSDLSACR